MLMQCEIIWNNLTLDQWHEKFCQIRQSNVLQSYAYGMACHKVNYQKPKWGLIQINGVDAGLVQILEAGFLFNLFHGVILDRGPLWFDGFGGVAHISAFYKEFDHQFPKRWGRKRRMIPEIEMGQTALKILNQCGLELVNTTDNYQTLWWNLESSEEESLAQLKSNWRGHLRQALNFNLEIEWDDTGKFLPWLIQIYEEDKQNKDYSGVSPQLLNNLALFSTNKDPMIIGKARIKRRDIAAILIICHGQSATYQIGWNSQEGRKYNAHHFLLWRAKFMLHSRGIKDLDLGGINNDEAAQGIKKFKEGTGAKISILAGHFR